MLTLEHSSSGVAISDYDAEDWVLEKYQWSLNPTQSEKIVVVSTENVITAARAMVATGKIPFNNLRFKIKNIIYHVKETGIIKDMPGDFCPHSVGWYRQIVDAVRKKLELREKDPYDPSSHKV